MNQLISRFFPSILPLLLTLANAFICKITCVIIPYYSASREDIMGLIST
jgi:hypothetical protein